MVDLGQGWWIERDAGRVRLTLRGTVSFEWPEARWAELMAQLEEPEPPANKDERVWHLHKAGETHTLCRKLIGERILLTDAPGRWLCFICKRKRRSG